MLRKAHPEDGQGTPQSLPSERGWGANSADMEAEGPGCRLLRSTRWVPWVCPEGSETHDVDGTGGPRHSCPCFYATGNTCLCCSGDAGSLFPGPPGAARSPGKLSLASALLLLHRGPGACRLVSGPHGKGARQGWGQTSETALQGC